MNHSIKFKEITIKNGRTYKNEVIKLSDNGITSIVGVNGGGKSTIWAILEAVFYGSTPLGHRRDSLVKNNKDAFFQVTFDKNDKEYKVVYQRVHGKWTHKITEDNVDITPHSAIDAASFAKDLLPLTQDEFENSVHLVQRGKHSLIDGKPAERKAFISQFFGISDKYSVIQDEAKKELEKIRQEISVVSGFSHSKQLLEDELKQIQVIDPSTTLEKLNQLNEEAKNLQSQVMHLNLELKNIQVYNSLLPLANSHENPEAKVVEVNSKKAEITHKLAQIESIKKANIQAKKQNDYYDSCMQALMALEDKYPVILGLNLVDLRARINECYQKRNAYQTTLSNRRQLELLPNVQYTDTTEYYNRLNFLQAEKGILTSRLLAIKAGKCPTCYTDFSCSAHETEEQKIQTIESEILELKDIINTLDTQNKNYQTRVALERTLQGIEIWTPEDEDELNRCLLHAQALEQYAQLTTALENTQKMPIQIEEDPTALNSELKNIEIAIQSIQQCLDAKSKLPNVTRTDPTLCQMEITNLTDKLQLITTEISELDRHLGVINTQNARAEKCKQQIADLVQKLSKLDMLKKKELLFQKLVDAYGPKGLIVKKLDNIMNLVMQRLPYYTNILFNDKDLEFGHRCDAGNIEIYVKRSERIDIRKKIPEYEVFEYDVSSMSGGEKQKLSISFVLTLADCVAINKKTNILILDEFDQNLDEEGQYNFVNELLPLLKQDYESIFVISHSTEVQQADVFDRVWKVEKENNWSRIIYN